MHPVLVHHISLLVNIAHSYSTIATHMVCKHNRIFTTTRAYTFTSLPSWPTYIYTAIRIVHVAHSSQRITIWIDLTHTLVLCLYTVCGRFSAYPAIMLCSSSLQSVCRIIIVSTQPTLIYNCADAQAIQIVVIVS